MAVVSGLLPVVVYAPVGISGIGLPTSLEGGRFKCIAVPALELAGFTVVMAGCIDRRQNYIILMYTTADSSNGFLCNRGLVLERFLLLPRLMIIVPRTNYLQPCHLPRRGRVAVPYLFEKEAENEHDRIRHSTDVAIIVYCLTTKGGQVILNLGARDQSYSWWIGGSMVRELVRHTRFLVSNEEVWSRSSGMVVASGTRPGYKYI